MNSSFCRTTLLNFLLLIWGSCLYSSSKYYQFSFRELHPEYSIIWIWKSGCVPKIKLFAWLLLNDKLNTRNMLRRRKKYLEDGYNCVLCQNGVEETMEHLFFDYPSSVSRWFAIGILWDEDANVHHKIYMDKQRFSNLFSWKSL